jgi:hypothetical protein
MALFYIQLFLSLRKKKKKKNRVAPHFPAIRNNSLIEEEKEGILLNMSQYR